MHFLRSQLRLCSIVDESLLGSGVALEHCQALIEGGLTSLFLRINANTLSPQSKDALKAISQLCRSQERYFFVMDDTLLALQLESHGVFFSEMPRNLGRVRELLGAERFIGVTVRDLSQAEGVNDADLHSLIDFVGVGPVHQYGDKNTFPLGLEMARALTLRVRTKPVFWLGGIRTAELTGFGPEFADGIGIVRPLNTLNPASEAQKIHRLLAKSLGPCVWSVGHTPANCSFRFSELNADDLKGEAVPFGFAHIS